MISAPIAVDVFAALAGARLRPKAPAWTDPTSNPPDLRGDHSIDLDPTPPAFDGPARPAAVLVPVVAHASDATVLLTRRTASLRDHSGQIAFPGGKVDLADPSPLATALREAEEEIGLDPSAVELLGTLPQVRTFVTGYVIYPHVGLIEPIEWKPSPNEVELVLELPLHALVSSFSVQPMTRRGFTFQTDTYVVGDHLIWGATARILGDLLRRLGPLAEQRRPEA